MELKVPLTSGCDKLYANELILNGIERATGIITITQLVSD